MQNSLDSVSISSEEISVARQVNINLPFQLIAPRSNTSRNPENSVVLPLEGRQDRSVRFFYTIHTYTSDIPLGSVVDKTYTFEIERPVNCPYADQLIKSIHPNCPWLTDERKFVPTNSKIALLKGRYKTQSAIVLSKIRFRRLTYKVLVADSTILTVKRSHFKLLDPRRTLPFGFPIN